MSTITKEFTKEQLIEKLKHRISVASGFPDSEKAQMDLELARIALASLEANGAIANEGTITATQFKPVADLYEVTVPSGRSTTFTKDAAEASDCRVMGWSVQEYVKLERHQAAMLQGAGGNSPAIQDGWVTCSERLPPEGYEPDGGAVCYLVWHKNEVDCGPQYSISNVFFLRKHWEKNYTHWMPLPAAPQQEVKP
ncbi:DUF551 domain-containing protein [Enterobacter hormaechei]|nr:DUF551 domain-containing protein [Enterobacter hormaechei]KTI14871.1 hypothetical protein ASV10_24405 [Enterobacter hormaechei subsp. xiangfangensis]KTJ11942.1 hypothetical protein ASU90_23345 [Enterobacter hormaechei subsp. xiangfangensis]MBN7891223.1 DUF551 domain-containing protein [Enterobacter hormaechei]CZV91874.1 Protein of uncharacterised function (DUF551) [Enterobacter hormaechei]CZY26019.1 Protein of uncharacterised function (DUF551) [Enterobacter hormaechei]